MPIPKRGMDKEEILERVQAMRAGNLDLSSGRVFAYGFHPERAIEETTRSAYNLCLAENGLDPTSFPGLVQMEKEVVRMIADLLRGDERVVGSFTSGGTESILLAVKTARDHARATRGITEPEMALPRTAHCAFHKACQYFQVKPVMVDFDPATFRTDVASMRSAISPRTALVVASAPSYAHGVVDPIREIGAIASERGALFHVDACVGGVALSIMRRSGEWNVADFDFSVPGVTSISTDMHKYGYSPKGASVVLHRSKDIRRYQIFSSMASTTYALINPTIQSTKSGGPLAGAWAALHALGEEGYQRVIRETMSATRRMMDAIRATGVLRVLGQPDMSLFAIASDELNVFELADEMKARGWYLQPQFSTQGSPINLHLTVSFANSAVVDEFIAALHESVAELRSRPPIDLVALRGQLESMLQGLSEEEALANLAALGGLSEGALPERFAMINSLIECLPRSLGERILGDFMNDLYA